MYNQKVLEIFKNPSNVGGLQGSNGSAKLEGDNGAEVVWQTIMKLSQMQDLKQWAML